MDTVNIEDEAQRLVNEARTNRIPASIAVIVFDLAELVRQLARNVQILEQAQETR